MSNNPKSNGRALSQLVKRARRQRQGAHQRWRLHWLEALEPRQMLTLPEIAVEYTDGYGYAQEV
jgi:hypothetical protein